MRRQTFAAAKSHPAAPLLQLQACILGGDDLAASLGTTRSSPHAPPHPFSPPHSLAVSLLPPPPPPPVAFVLCAVYCMCRQTFQAAQSHPAASLVQLQACILGGDDLAASLGATRTPDNSELQHARGMFLLTCRAMQVRGKPCLLIYQSSPILDLSK
jgi:citrate lyase beta subunit